MFWTLDAESSTPILAEPGDLLQVLSFRPEGDRDRQTFSCFTVRWLKYKYKPDQFHRYYSNSFGEVWEIVQPPEVPRIQSASRLAYLMESLL